MRGLRRSCAPLAALPLLLGAAPPAPPPAPPPPTAVRVNVETIVVDGRGTRSLGSDVADLFPGGTGVLTKKATLLSREGTRPAAREKVDMTVRLTPSIDADRTCTLLLETETRAVPAGAPAAGRKLRPPDRTRAVIVLKDGQERLVDAYASVATQGRLALRLSCGQPATDAGEVLPGVAPQFIGFLLAVSRGEGDKDPEPLKTDELRAVLGHEASSQFSFNVPLDPDASGARRYRRENLEVAIKPTLFSGGRVQVAIGVRGEMATIGASGDVVRHPIEHADTWVVTPGETRTIDIEVRSSGAQEGWERVRYHLALTGSF